MTFIPPVDDAETTWGHFLKGWPIVGAILGGCLVVMGLLARLLLGQIATQLTDALTELKATRKEMGQLRDRIGLVEGMVPGWSGQFMSRAEFDRESADFVPRREFDGAASAGRADRARLDGEVKTLQRTSGDHERRLSHLEGQWDGRTSGD